MLWVKNFKRRGSRHLRLLCEALIKASMSHQWAMQDIKGDSTLNNQQTCLPIVATCGLAGLCTSCLGWDPTIYYYIGNRLIHIMSVSAQWDNNCVLLLVCTLNSAAGAPCNILKHLNSIAFLIIVCTIYIVITITALHHSECFRVYSGGFLQSCYKLFGSSELLY